MQCYFIYYSMIIESLVTSNIFLVLNYFLVITVHTNWGPNLILHTSQIPSFTRSILVTIVDLKL